MCTHTRNGNPAKFIPLLSLSFLLLMSSVGHAATQIPFFYGVLNQLSDNSAGYLINAPGSAPGDVTLDVGDRLRGVLRIETIEDLQGGGGVRMIVGPAQPTELTAIYDITVVAKTLITTIPVNTYHFTFGPAPAAIAWAGLPGPVPAPGTMVRFYEDPAKNFTRLLTPDDGDPAFVGADVGIGPFVSEETLVALSTDGSPYWDFGLTGPVVNGQPTPTAGEGWVSDAIDNVKLARLINPPTAAGTGNFALNLISRYSGPSLGKVDSYLWRGSRFQWFPERSRHRACQDSL